MEARIRMETRGKSPAKRRSRLAFARETVSLNVPEPAPVREVVRELRTKVEVAQEVEGTVRLQAARHSLSWVLDRITDQVSAEWRVVVRLDRRNPPDAAAADQERMRTHFDELSGLPPAERREEIAAELDRIEALPVLQQTAAVSVMARDVLSLGTHLRETPGEHRGPVWAGVLGISRAYSGALAALPAGRRALFDPVSEALGHLAARLTEIR
jgi:hypothetical protein